MQTPTHIVAGMVIQKAFEGKNRKTALTAAAVVAFLSHGFLDKLAQITYHPANPDFHSAFWVSYHLTLLATTVVFLFLWWRQYKWGIIFANLPDVDWIFIHGQEIFHFQIPFYRQPHLHHLLGHIYEKIPPLSFVTVYLDRLPNERHNPWACLWEVLLVALMLVAFWLLTLAKAYHPARPVRNDATAGAPMTGPKVFGIVLAVAGLCLLPAAGQSFEAARAHKDAVFTSFFQQTNHWAAGDVASTIPLSDGRVLWLFGDSYIDQCNPATGTVPCLFDARNCALIQDTNDLLHPNTLCQFDSKDKSLFRPPGGAEFWPCFWPGGGFQSGNTVYVYLNEMQKTPEGGMWGFKAIGQFWAKMSFPELKVAGYTQLPSFNGISFSSGFVHDREGDSIYAFGDKQHGLGSDVYVARFPAARPEGRWTFWDGKNWNADVTHAAAITQGASVSVNVCKVKNLFLLVTTAFSVGCDQGKEIYVSTSDRPTGPFSPHRKIFTVDDAVNGHLPFFYSVVAHPEFLNGNGLLITYCVNGYEPCIPNCVNGRMNPDYYRPRAIRLPLN